MSPNQQKLPRPQAPHLKYVTLNFENLGFDSEIFLRFETKHFHPLHARRTFLEQVFSLTPKYLAIT